VREISPNRDFSLHTEYSYGKRKLNSDLLKKFKTLQKAIADILNRQNVLQSMTDGIHLWGKRKSKLGRRVSHCGDLNTFFESGEKKNIFLEWLANFLQDNRPRYFVPEVNSSDEDLHSIIKDLEAMKIKFG